MLQYTQNFLHSQPLVARLVELAGLTAGDTVLEIGPGKGIITVELAHAVGDSGHVVAVELDAGLAQAATKRFAPMPQIELVEGNILDYDLALLGPDYRLFSNVPFNITSALLTKLFAPQVGPPQAHLILQTDALIGTNKGGYKTETLKSLLLKPLYEIATVHTFQASDFRPKPSVSTTLFSFKRRPVSLITADDYAQYQDFLACAAKDRVGEGVWRKLFSKKQLATIAQQTNLVMGRGLKSQQLEPILHTFSQFKAQSADKQRVVRGAFEQLRAEQQHRDATARAGGHHRTKKRRR